MRSYVAGGAEIDHFAQSLYPVSKRGYETPGAAWTLFFRMRLSALSAHFLQPPSTKFRIRSNKACAAPCVDLNSS